jgi:hypothetical protein
VYIGKIIGKESSGRLSIAGARRMKYCDGKVLWVVSLLHGWWVAKRRNIVGSAAV